VVRRRVRGFFYTPSNALVKKFTAEDRRMFAFWTIVVSVILYPFLGGLTFYVSALSIVALFANYTSETPVEKEK
jgi:hypothetical protein